MKEKIFTRLYEKATLLDHHRKELKTKRGFNDRTIDELCFFSGGDYLNKIISELKDEFPIDKLVESGIVTKSMDKRTGEYVFDTNKKLVDDNVIIPFIRKKGNSNSPVIYHLYPHKNGFKGEGVVPYCDFLMKIGRSDTIIITESPFKAAALYQVFGDEYSYCGLSGIASFYEKNFEQLKFKKKIKKAIIIFDNEVKNNPNFPNFKEDYRKRYDTEFYAYLMAWKLSKSKASTTIATLPDEWMEKGKIDCDGALAQGRTKKDFVKVLKSAITHQEYKKNFTGERKFVIDRKLRRKFFKSPIFDKINQYWAIEESESGKDKIYKLTNFKLEITKEINVLNAPGEEHVTIRKARFIDSHGEKSSEFTIDAKVMAKFADFCEFAFRKGQYVVYKKARSYLHLLWEMLLVETRSPLIHKYAGVGMIKPGLWVMGDCLIFNGAIIKINKEGLFQNGYQAIMPPDKQRCLPYLMNKEEITPDEIINLFWKNLGFNGVIVVAMVPAVLFSDIIFEHYHQFPLLGLFGKTGSGKTTVGKWLFSCFGIRDDPVNISTSTEKGLTRNLSRLRSLPFWADEYRSNDRKTKSLTQTLLNVYNRASSTRANYSNDDQTLSHEINGALMLSGQATPDDEALYSRIVGVNLSEWERNPEFFQEIQSKYRSFSNLTLEILKNEKEIRNKLPAVVKEVVEHLLKSIPEPRIAENYGCIVGSFICAIEVLGIQDKLEFSLEEFADWCYRHIESTINVKRGKDELLGFYRDVDRLLTSMTEDEREINKGGIERYLISKKREGKVFLAIHDAWVLYEKDLAGRRKSPTFSYEDIKSYIEKEPYFRGYPNKQKKKKFLGKAKPCIILDYGAAVESIFPSVLGAGDDEDDP